MANNFIHPGDRSDFQASSDIAAGTALILGKRVGVSLTDVVSGETGTAAMTGVFRLPKGSAAIGQGADVYLSAGGSVSTTASGNTLAGYADAGAASGDDVVDVMLNG